MLKVLYIYRHSDMGYSIGRVFKPIEEEMRKYCEVDAVYMPVPNYSLKGLWKNIRTARKAVKQKHYDIVHITGAEHYLIPFLNGHRLIVTVHDLGFYTNHPKTIKQRWKSLLFIKTLKWADCVTFISEKSKSEALKLVTLKKTLVISDTIGTDFELYPKQINTQKPVVLQLGTKDNKNLLRTIAALNGVSCHLRIIGPLSTEQVEALKSNDIEYSNVSNLTDAQIIEEYKSCDIVSLPSLYEGFGMPIIEGQAIGRAVVTSDVEPMNKVAGNSAVLVNPTDIKSIREGFIRAIENQQHYIHLGMQNVKRYRLDKITQEYYNLYQSLS